MTTSPLFVDGKRLDLGERIGRGGEGEVYALRDNPDIAVKVYTVDPSTREQKITAMVNAGLAEKTPLIAFPKAIVKNKDGRFAGFLMGRVASHKPLFDLYSPAARRMAFPRADYRFLVGVATNIAWLVNKAHQAGCVIGDINQSGILVSKDGKPALIDADSFQVTDGQRQFLCLVGVPEYTPPELRGAELSKTPRTPNHDAFGLAVVIFQLLFMGRHPFVGPPTRGEIPLDQAIKEYRFAYSMKRDSGMRPPPGACTLSDIPQSARDAFEQAFAKETRDNRPSAATWVTVLGELSNSLRQCSNNSLHHHFSSTAECPWCRMERQLGIILFLPPHVTGETPTLPTFDPSEGGFNLDQVWAAIQSAAMPNLQAVEPVLPALQVTASAEVGTARGSRHHPVIFGGVMIAAGVALVGLVPGAALLWLALIGFGVAVARTKSSPSPAFNRRYISAEQNFQRAKYEWRARLYDFGAVEGLKQRLAHARSEYTGLASLQQQWIRDFESKRREQQLHAFLDTFEISRAQFPGIGLARRQTLMSYGIDTAADCTEAKLFAIPGFGPGICAPLLAWRKSKSQQFVYDGRLNPADAAEVNKIKAKIRAEAQKLRQQLTTGASELARLSAEANAKARQPDGAVVAAYREVLQAKTDLEALSIPLPFVTPVPPPLPPSPPPQLRTSSSRRRHGAASSATTPSSLQASNTPACPQCGSTMRRRTARRGRFAGRPFWGCSRWPGCNGRRQI